jgi:hypothetical protein
VELLLLVIHPVVDERVDHCIGHGEPIEGQVHMLHIAARCYRVVVISIYEVAMIRQPAERKDGHHNDEHPHHLQENTHCHQRILLYINK